METTHLRPVRPARPIAAYIGGKKRLAPLIIERIGAIPHRSYAEPFVGMGGIFLRRDRRPSAETINDISGEVVNLFRVVQRHAEELERAFRFLVTARATYEVLQATDPRSLTDIERAARFLYLQRASYGGKVAGQTFGVSPWEPGAVDRRKLRPLIEALNERLASVVIENLPYGTFIERYDRPGVLFYLDPPYHGSEDDYGAGVFLPGEFERMAAQLGGLKGRFLLSINDTPEIRRIFAAFPMEEVRLRYTIGRASTTDAAELLICDARSADCLPQRSLFDIRA
ncbi:DNA adenine methylase [Ancylobacter dichloromethanicus]|uniref:site-specific DNA-methyltransferase (adenine-specific) n=1 Tax=Ancylobacter dichloromethanicus TaxID=518825 RepID=A0A9W6MZ76_9HYPH|nr:DNA adenine methylase [Ancylobacter dichloromethanicus]MBS7554595.1 DNA adenine methylase [Ancylobacter dichloromethanicus]GLK71725.1 DNA methyltransferase [Ancylobacter dichloromethanicus]